MRQFVAFFRDHFEPANPPDPDAPYTTIMASNNFMIDMGFLCRYIPI
jgi:hypothetical protein